MDDFKKPTKKLQIEPTENFKDPKVDHAEHFPSSTSNLEPIPTVNIDLDNQQPYANTEKMSIGAKMSKLFKNKKVIIGVSVVAIVLIAGGVFLVINGGNKKPVASTTTVTQKKVVEKKVVSPLTGIVLKDPSLAKRPVTAIMIENSPDARPQSGLSEADIIYEAIAEGGVTRFMAVYQESQPQYIGPIRSARPYYIDYALPLEASFGHVGGSPEALRDIKDLGVRDIDQFFNDSGYWRITDRFAPHNMYSSFEKLDEVNKAKGFNSSKFVGFERKAAVPQTPTAKVIDFSISGPLYSPRFEYDQTTNSYKRIQAGQPHNDAKSGATISPKVVIGLVVPNGSDGDGYHSTYNTTGSGVVYIFQDGIVSEGNWSKKDRKSPLVITDKNGLPLKLNSGQTWVSLVGTSSDITYKP